MLYVHHGCIYIILFTFPLLSMDCVTLTSQWNTNMISLYDHCSMSP